VGCALVRRHTLPLVAWSTDHVDRGPVSDRAETLSECVTLLADVLSDQGSTCLTVGPYWPRVCAASVEESLLHDGFRSSNAGDGVHSVSLDIDLNASEAELLASFRQSTRYEVRKAERIGVQVIRATNTADISEFVALYAEMAGAHGIRALGESQLKRLGDHLREYPDHGVILLTRLGDDLLAGHVVLRHGRRAVYTFGASSPGSSRGVPKSQLGLWRAIQWAKAGECSVFDLGGIDPTAAEGTALSSINQFKRGFSTHQIELLPSYEKVLRPMRHAVVEAAQKTARRLA